MAGIRSGGIRLPSDILNEVGRAHSDLKDLKKAVKELKRANKKFGNRGVSTSSLLGKRHHKGNILGLNKPKEKKFLQGDWKVTKPPKQIQYIQAAKKNSSAKVNKPPEFAGIPSGLAAFKKENQLASRKASSNPISSQTSQGKAQVGRDAFSTMGYLVLKLKTPAQALEFKKTLNHHASKGFSDQQTETLQKKLTLQLTKIASNKQQAHKLTDKLLVHLVNSEKARNTIIQIRNKIANSDEGLAARLKTLQGRDNLPSEKQLQHRLDELKKR